MPILRKRANRKGGDSGEIERSPTPVTPSPNGNHVDPTSEPGTTNKDSMRNRIKEIRGTIRGNIKKRLSTSSISFPREDARAEDDQQQQAWPALRNSISSIATSLRNHRSSTESRSSQETARQPTLNRSQIGCRVSQDAERRSHTIHGRPTTPTLGRSGSNMRRFSLGTLPEPSPDNDSTPRLPSLHNMLARTEGKASSKDSAKGIEGQSGPFGDSAVPVFEIDWHDIASHIPCKEEEAGRQKTVAKDHTPIPGRLPIRIKQAQPSAIKTSDGPSVVANINKRGSTSDSGISGCLEPAVEYLLAGHETTEEQKTSQGSPQSDMPTLASISTTTTTTESGRRVSIKWANQVLEADATTPTLTTTTTTTPNNPEPPPPPPPPPPPRGPRSRTPFQTSKVPTHWLDSILETSLPLRTSSPPFSVLPLSHPTSPYHHHHHHHHYHLDSSSSSSNVIISRRAQRRLRRRRQHQQQQQQTTSRIAVVAPAPTGERLLPRQHYADFGAATRDLFRRFRYQYAPLMALVLVPAPAPTPTQWEGATAIYLFAPRDVARREDVEARMRMRGKAACVFDIEEVLDEDWGGLREVLGAAGGRGVEEMEEEKEMEGDGEEGGEWWEEEEAELPCDTVRVGGLEWVDPEGEAYMRSELSLLLDDDDLELASRLG
ncbi:hypothetical protein F4809DRAFT_637905 [Biscogniauxia mediterranea]|nr:hypothetical protein F4809DRAFT_637905 [Biscogniauxia mediterranea]